MAILRSATEMMLGELEDNGTFSYFEGFTEGNRYLGKFPLTPTS